jgi:pyridoxine 5-phosphate synthase
MNIHQQMQIIELGVKIDLIAGLRNVRAKTYPDPVRAALLAEEAGADCVTLHIRKDRKAIPDADVAAIRMQLCTRLNLAMAPTAELTDFACKIRPQDVCLLSEDSQDVKDGNSLDVLGQFSQIQAATRQLQAADIRVSLLVDARDEHIQAAAEAGAYAVEICTAAYSAAHDPGSQAQELQRLRQAALTARRHGLTVNAGHGLDYANVQAIAAIPDFAMLNIGHAIVAHAVFHGWQKAVSEMKAMMVKARLNAG